MNTRVLTIAATILMATHAGIATSSAQSIETADAVCRRHIGRAVRELASNILEEERDCQSDRMRGLLSASVDCTDLSSPGFPAASRAKVEAIADALRDKVTAQCEDASAPAANGFAACAAPCDGEVPAIASYGDVAECLICRTENLTTTATTEVYGDDPPIEGAQTEVWRCQDRYLGIGLRKYFATKLSQQSTCQYKVDRGTLAATDCQEADLTGKIEKAADWLTARVAKCDDTDLAELDSCSSSVAGEQACLLAAADALSDGLFTDVYGDGETPSGSDCAADDFLDVSQAPGAGASYAAPALTASCTDDEVVVQSNSIPHYSFVQTTPNPLVVNNVTYRFPRYPEVAASTTDIPLLGTVGVAVNGLPFFGPNEAAFPDPYGDPYANAILDECLGHTAFIYHYHALLQKCLTESGLVAEPWLNADPPSNEPSPVLGYALDGFPVYGPYGCLDGACSQVVEFESGWENIGYQSVGCTSSAQCSTGYTCAPTIIGGARVRACVPETYAWANHAYVAKSDPRFLDECNGHYGPDGDYHYHATATFPYILGCFSGTR